MPPIRHGKHLRPALLATTALSCLLPAADVSAQDNAAATFLNGKIPDALAKGKFSLNARLRYEGVDQSNLAEDSNALTLRTRFGFTTAPLHGFQAMIEAENIFAVAPEHNYNAAGSNGQGGRPVVADPTTTELNQAWLSYGNTNWMSSVKAGRQMINLDNARFVGNVAWRQNMQTFDAVALKASPVKDLTLSYHYLWSVNRIFGDVSGLPAANRDFDSASHLINAAYAVSPLLKFGVHAYLLDLDNAAGANQSSATYGGHVGGAWTFDAEKNGKLTYRGEFAWQTDHADSTLDYQTEYYLAEVGAEYGLFNVGLGYEVLGSDNNQGFRTPLATLHAFNGWADAFLNTPGQGLRDLYVSAGVKLPGGIPLKVIYHKFDADSGGADFGHEIDVIASRSFGKHWSVLAKYAHYDGKDAPVAFDKQIFWAQVEFNY